MKHKGAISADPTAVPLPAETRKCNSAAGLSSSRDPRAYAAVANTNNIKPHLATLRDGKAEVVTCP
jgi:hypothetical protein